MTVLEEQENNVDKTFLFRNYQRKVIAVTED